MVYVVLMPYQMHSRYKNTVISQNGQCSQEGQQHIITPQNSFTTWYHSTVNTPQCTDDTDVNR